MKRRNRRLRREDFESNDNYSTAPEAVDAGDAHDNRELDKENGPDKEPDHTEDPGGMEIMTKSGAATEILQQIQTMKKEDVIRLRNLLLGEEEGDEKRGDDDLFDDETEEPVEDSDEDDEPKNESYLGEEEDPDEDDEDEEGEDSDEDDEPKNESYLGEEDEEKDDEDEDHEEPDDDEEEGEEGDGDEDDDKVEINIDNLKKEDLKLGVNIGKLFEGKDFTPAFKKRVTEMFEAAVLANVNRTVRRVNEMANRELRLLGKRQKAKLTEHADRYLTTVARQFVRENRMAIDNGLKAEMFDSLVAGLGQVMNEHNLKVPGKRDLVEQLVARLDRVEGKLNNQIRANIMMSEDLDSLGREYALMEAASGLSNNQTEKLRALSEGFDYSDHDEFVGKLKSARQSFLESEDSDEGKQRRVDRRVKQDLIREDFNPVEPSPENGVSANIVDVVAEQLTRSSGKI